MSKTLIRESEGRSSEVASATRAVVAEVGYSIDPLSTRTPRVLVVEDDVDMARSLQMRLSAHGYQTEVAADHIKAINGAVNFSPDVILMDIGLPLVDGHVIASRLRSLVLTSNIPIIYLTARTSMVDRLKAEDNFAYAYVTKPFRSEELIRLVDEVVEVETTLRSLAQGN